MFERSAAVIAVYVILKRARDGQIFLIQRAHTGYMDGHWHLPSGHMEMDQRELPMIAAAREVREEVGVVISPYSIQCVHVSFRPQHDDTGPRMDLFFSTCIWRGEPHNAEPSKCSAVCWAHPANLPMPMTPHVREAINNIQRGMLYAELGDAFLSAHGIGLAGKKLPIPCA